MIEATTSEAINMIVALLFILGIIGIYLPQYYKIYTKKSSYGLSNYFMILGNTATLLSSVNSIIYYINAFPCKSKQVCVEKLMGLGIIILQWILFLINYIMFVRYHPSGWKDPIALGKSKIDWRVTGGFVASNVVGVICLALTMGFLAMDQWHYDASDISFSVWSDILEVLITGLFLLHYLPQIWETYKLKDIGSISLISLGIMCPGSFVWTIFLATQSKITDNPNASQPQVWIPYLIVGMMQLILLIMGMVYDRRKKRKYDYLLNISEEHEEHDLEIPYD